jgi:hypothetical protein
VRPDRRADVLELLHEALVDVQAPDVSTMRTSLPSCLAWSSAHRAMSTGSRSVPLLVDRRPGLGADLDELVDRGRAVDVARGDADRRPCSLAEELRELARRGRLARALQAGHEDHVGGRGENATAPAGAAEELRELLVDDLHDLLARVELAR